MIGYYAGYGLQDQNSIILNVTVNYIVFVLCSTFKCYHILEVPKSLI